jgi:hypothetical protein
LLSTTWFALHVGPAEEVVVVVVVTEDFVVEYEPVVLGAEPGEAVE